MIDSREPPNGDFVAYVEKIEREQLARAMQPHRLQPIPATGKAATGDREPVLSAAEAQRLLHVLKARGKAGGPPLGAMIGLVLGAALIAFGLLAEGGIVLVLLGAVLLWHNLRKMRGGGVFLPSPAQQTEAVFGRGAPDGASKRSG